MASGDTAGFHAPSLKVCTLLLRLLPLSSHGSPPGLNTQLRLWLPRAFCEFKPTSYPIQRLQYSRQPLHIRHPPHSCFVRTQPEIRRVASMKLPHVIFKVLSSIQRNLVGCLMLPPRSVCVTASARSGSTSCLPCIPKTPVVHIDRRAHAPASCEPLRQHGMQKCFMWARRFMRITPFNMLGGVSHSIKGHVWGIPEGWITSPSSFHPLQGKSTLRYASDAFHHFSCPCSCSPGPSSRPPTDSYDS